MRAGLDGHHHRSVDRGDADLAAIHRLVERDRQVEAHIVAFAAIERMPVDRDGDEPVAGAAGALLALALEPHLRPVLDPLGQFEVDRLAVRQRDSLVLERGRIDKGNAQLVGDIRAFLGRAAMLRTAERAAAGARLRPAATEQALLAPRLAARHRRTGLRKYRPDRLLRRRSPACPRCETRAGRHWGGNRRHRPCPQRDWRDCRRHRSRRGRIARACPCRTAGHRHWSPG